MTDPADTAAPRPSFLDRLGPRATRRAEPRTSTALAGAGCALAVSGVLVLAGDASDSDGSFDRLPGIVLSLLVVAAGLLVLQLQRRGPLATAGSVALAAGIPAAIGFAVVGGSDGRLDTAIAIATVAWLAAYVVGPGRGRPVFLGLGLYGIWSTALQIAGATSVLPLLGLSPLGFLTFGETCSYDSFSGTSECRSTGPFGGLSGPGGFDQPDWAALGLVSLAVGVGYLLLSRRLDRGGRHGMSSPFVIVGLLAIVQGVVAIGIELRDAQGVGAVLLAASVGVALFGGSTGRRFTTWLGGAGSVVGIAMLVLPDVDSANVAGLLLLGAGLVVVVVTHLVAEQLNEPDELAYAGAPWAPPGPPEVAGSGPVADAPIAVIDRDPEWADPSVVELEPMSPPPKQAAPKKRTATAKPAPAKKAVKKAVKKRATDPAAKPPPRKAAPAKRVTKKRPPTS